jgi:hypothetical protein
LRSDSAYCYPSLLALPVPLPLHHSIIQSIAAKILAEIIRERWYCDVYVDDVECNSSRYTDCFGVAKASLAKVKFCLPD